MKKFFALAAVAALAAAFTGCDKDDDPVAVTGVTLNKTELTLAVGAKETLSATISPLGADFNSFAWSSSNTDVATVNASTGEVTAVAAGSANIVFTVAYGAGATKTGTCAVTVNAAPVTITGDGIGDTPLEIKASESMPAPTVPVRVAVAASEGIENFKVLITSSSNVFMGALTPMGLATEFDLANPGALAAAFAGLEAEMGIALPYGDAVKGKTELQFDITAFVPMIFGVRTLAGETGDCAAAFKITVTDTKGTSKEATVSLSLIDDVTPAE